MDGRAAGERAEDAAYLRIDWCIAFIFGCERHGVRLVTKCPACNARPKWHIGRIDRCHCGFQLRACRPEPMPSSESGILSFLLDRLHGRSSTSPRLCDTADVPLADLVNLIRLLGEVSSVRDGPPAQAASLEVDHLGELLVNGSDVLSALPGSFEALLDRLFNGNETAARSAAKFYGLPLARWMRSDRPFIDVLRPIFDKHAREHASIPIKVAGVPSANSQLLERTTRRLTPKQMERLRHAVDWMGPTPARRNEVLEVGRRSGAVMLTQAAERYLDIPHRCFKELRAAGAVEPCWEKAGDLFFYRSELDQFLRELRRDAPVFTSCPPHLWSLARLRAARQVTLATMLLRLLNGDLECSGVLVDVRGISGLLFESDEAGSERRRYPIGAVDGRGLRELLQLNSLHLKAAKDAGILELKGHRSDFSEVYCWATYCTWPAILTFDSRFVSLARTARSIGENTQKVRHRLQAVEGSCVLHVKHGGIYSRKAVERVFGPDAVPLVRQDGGS